MTTQELEKECKSRGLKLTDVGHYRKGSTPIIHTVEGNTLIEHKVDPKSIIGECDKFIWVDRRIAYRMIPEQAQ